MGPPLDAPDINAPDRAAVRLTQFSHGGGCGCKIAPAVLQQIVAKTVPGIVPKELLVGIETAGDAAVYQINATQAIVALRRARSSPIRRPPAGCSSPVCRTPSTRCWRCFATKASSAQRR